MASLMFINTLRYSVLILSLIAFVFHFMQCFLFSKYQERTKIPGWFSAGHWQYLTWYISLGVSLLSAVAICMHATCCRRGHILRGDRCLSMINIILSIFTMLSITFFSGQEPWTNGIVEFKRPSRGLITFCHLLNQDTDASYPLLYQREPKRCLLWDGAWIGTAALCAGWILLGFCATWIKPRRRDEMVYEWPQQAKMNPCATAVIPPPPLPPHHVPYHHY